VALHTAARGVPTRSRARRALATGGQIAAGREPAWRGDCMSRESTAHGEQGALATHGFIAGEA
jgi:hypothetical protein